MIVLKQPETTPNISFYSFSCVWSNSLFAKRRHEYNPLEVIHEKDEIW